MAHLALTASHWPPKNVANPGGGSVSIGAALASLWTPVSDMPIREHIQVEQSVCQIKNPVLLGNSMIAPSRYSKRRKLEPGIYAFS
jgi:hypothetical protein